MARRNKRLERRIAGERMERLLELAEEAALAGRVDRANRYVELARRVGMKAQRSLPLEGRLRVCRGCHGYLLPGRTARVRVRGGVLVTTCLACGRANRRPVAPRGGGDGE